MSLTRKQIQVLHVVAHKLGIAEPERRLIQRNLGGFHACNDPTASQEGFVAVMAWYENRAGGRLAGYTDRYWQSKELVGEDRQRLLWRIDREREALGMTSKQLDEFMAGKHMSNGLYGTVEEAPAAWLHKLLQGLIEINRRRRREAG